MAYNHHKRTILLGSVDKKINLFQVAFRKYTKAGSISLPSPPHAICAERFGSTHKDLIVVGDADGVVSVYDHNDWTEGSNPRLMCSQELHYDVNDVRRQRTMSVRKMALWPNIGLVSAGMDGRLVICKDIEHLSRNYKTLREGHTRGVFAFAHSPMHRCFVSAGYDRRILIWDPFLPTPVGQLAKTSSDVVDVVINQGHNQIITVTSDRKIKVYDIRTHTQVCSLVDSAEYLFQNEHVTAAAFDHENQRLITACNKIRLWPVRKSTTTAKRVG